jgi:hypothetical protein
MPPPDGCWAFLRTGRWITPGDVSSYEPHVEHGIPVLPGFDVRWVLGPRGKTIKALQEYTGAYITLEKPSMWFCVIGHWDSVELALAMITDMMFGYFPEAGIEVLYQVAHGKDCGPRIFYQGTGFVKPISEPPVPRLSGLATGPTQASKDVSPEEVVGCDTPLVSQAELNAFLDVCQASIAPCQLFTKVEEVDGGTEEISAWYPATESSTDEVPLMFGQSVWAMDTQCRTLTW